MIFCVFVAVFRGFRPQKPFQTVWTCFFYPGKARQCRFSWIQVRFRPISGFGDFRFLCPGILVLGFLSFRGPGSGFKSNYEQNQPSGGSTFSKTTPPGFQEQGGSGFPKNLANHLLLVLKSERSRLFLYSASREVVCINASKGIHKRVAAAPLFVEAAEGSLHY